jgi:hypothetical protein
MNYLKKYEEFDWQSLIHNQTFQSIAGFVMSGLFVKFGSKYILNKKKRKYFEEIMSGKSDRLYTSRSWEIKEDDKEIKVYKKKIFSNNAAAAYILNKKTREFRVISDTYPITVKLSKSEFNEMLEDFHWTKNVYDSIEDTFYDLQDEGFDIFVKRVDFKFRSIIISLTKKNHIDYDEEEYDGYHYDGGIKRHSFDLMEIQQQLRDFISRIESTYDVKIDDNFKTNEINEFVINSNTVDILNNNLKTPIKKYQLYSTTSLIIPFIKK